MKYSVSVLFHAFFKYLLFAVGRGGQCGKNIRSRFFQVTHDSRFYFMLVAKKMLFVVLFDSLLVYTCFGVCAQKSVRIKYLTSKA